MNTQLHNGLELALICRLPADVVAGALVSLNDVVRVTVDQVVVVDGVRVGVVVVPPAVAPTFVAALQNTQVVLVVGNVVRLVADVVPDVREVSDVVVRKVLREVVPQVDVVNVVVLNVREVVHVVPVPATNLEAHVVSGVSVRRAG